MSEALEKLDIGCGSRKDPSYIGLDHKPFPGVDVVFDLNSGEPWPLEDGRFEYIMASHIIEHVHDTLHFFSEAHRVATNGAIVHIETPHYSSRDSWIDPTHVRHFSLFFTDQIVDGSLLEDAEFELLNRELSFGSLVKTFPQRLWAAIFGLASYERFCAWRWPARNIKLDLRVVK
jgi:SAM-dependent methyltransferase